MKKIYYPIRNSFLLSLVCCILPFGRLAAQPDISVMALVSPVVPFCSGTNPVEIVLHNAGADTVYTANLDWTVNGVSQVPFIFNDTLAPSETQQVVIGSFFFNRKVSYQLSIVSSDPNGLPDADPSNDSLLTGNFSSRMSGSYSAGIIADYATLTDAVNDLANRGVCGPVILNINPGTFNEQLKITSIDGASAVNTVTFQSSTADSTSVIITFPSSVTAADNYTVRLDGADHLIFNQVTLERRGSFPHAHVVELTRNATHNIFTNSRFAGGQNVTNSSLAAIVYSDSSAVFRDTVNMFLRSLFLDGASAIFFEGSAHSPESGITVADNQFVNQFAGGLLLEDLESVQVTSNIFRSTAVNANYVAVQCTGCLLKSQVLKNRIINSPGFGISMSGCQGDSANRILVANNMVQSGDSAGIILDASLFLDAVYNTVEQTSADTDHTALLVSGATASTVVKNNILVNSGGGMAYAITDSANNGITSSDYNDLYVTGLNTSRLNGADLATLADWKLATGFDMNSVAADPGFLSGTDLHASSYYVDNKGKYVAEVSEDIDGETRSVSTPDIGADEFTAVIHDLALTALLSPTDGGCEDSVTAVRLLVHNTGGFGETGFIIQAQISGAAVYQLTDTVLVTIAAGTFDTLTFSQPINTLGGGQFTFQCSITLLFDIEPGNDSLLSVVTLIPLLPPASATGGAESCGPDSVQLTASGSSVLYWYDAAMGGNLLDTGNAIQYFAVATDTLYVQNGATCPSGRAAVPILVHDLPVLSLGNDTVLISPQTVTLTADTGYVTYLWNTGDTVPSIVVDSSGLYIVTVTDSNGCTGSDTILVDIISAVHDLADGRDLQIFPNPATGVLHVEWNLAAQEEVQLTMEDISGRVVYRRRMDSRYGIFKVDLEVGHFARGVYMLRVQSAVGTTGKRLVLY